MEVSHCPPIVGTHTPNRKRLDCGSFTGADMESSVHPGATPDSLKELWNSFERACMESLTEPPTDIVDRVAATLEDAISWLCSHSPQVFLPRHRGDSNCQGPKVSSSQLPPRLLCKVSPENIFTEEATEAGRLDFTRIASFACRISFDSAVYRLHGRD